MFEPKNEQGVIVAFQAMCHTMGLEILSIQSAFPDAILFDQKQNRKIRVEFEYSAMSFVAHKHDPRGADLIVCWKRGRGKLELPVLELSTFTTYPPGLNEPVLEKQERPKKLRAKNHLILVIGHVFIYERKDGSEASIIISDCIGSGGTSLNAIKGDDSPKGIVIWGIIGLAKQASGDMSCSQAQKAELYTWQLLEKLYPNDVKNVNGQWFLLPYPKPKKHREAGLAKIEAFRLQQESTP